MRKFSLNSVIRKQPAKGVFIEVIWKSHHRHLCISIDIEISIGIGIPKCLFLPSEFFLNYRVFMFLLVLSYGISTTLLQILISLQFRILPSKGGHWCSRKRLYELLEASVHWCFEKMTSPKMSAYFPAKHSVWGPF